MSLPFRRAVARTRTSTTVAGRAPRLARRLRMVALLGGVVGAGAWSAAPVGAAVVTAVAPTQGRIHVFPSLGAARAHPTSCTTSCAPMTYHGGSVQHAEKEYFIYWTPAGYYMPPSYRSGLTTWLSDVAAGAYTAGNVFSVAQQYYDNSGSGGAHSFVPNAISSAAAIVDKQALPPSGCSDSDGGTSLPVCLTDAQIRTEVQRVVTTHGLPQNTNTQYYLFTPKNVGSCFSSASTSCSYTNYCAYHGYFAGPSGQIVYANMPWTYSTSGCDANKVFALGYPNGSAIDPEVGVLSHEMIETMTDPNLNAWYDSSGSEIGDKCAYIYGAGGYGSSAGLANNGLGYWNQNLHHDQYLMQQEFSNRDSDGSTTGCVSKNSDTQPVVTVAILPNPPAHGSPASFTANVTDPAGVSTVAWTFGDGATAIGSPVNHTYAAAGAETVTVIVTDNHGNQKKVTQTVNVS